VHTLAAPDSAPARYYGPAEVRHWYPCHREGKPSHPSKVVRHIIRGAKQKDGSRLKLKATRFPGGWGVTQEDFDQFIAALTADRMGEAAPAPLRSPGRRQRDLDRVDRELAEMGL
jgi:hypothetical protein